MSAARCAKCEAFVNTDYDDEGMLTDNGFLCGACCEEIRAQSPIELTNAAAYWLVWSEQCKMHTH